MEHKPKISKAQQQRTNAWNAKAYDRVSVSVSKGNRAIIEAHAASLGLSINKYVCGLITSDIGFDVTKTQNKEQAPE